MMDSIEGIKRLERIENHLSSLKNQSENCSEDIRMIKTALVGNEFSKETGLVHRMQITDKKVEVLVEKDHKNSVYINQLKFVVGIIATIIVGFIFNLILNK